jgi:hypothetical protein
VDVSISNWDSAPEAKESEQAAVRRCWEACDRNRHCALKRPEQYVHFKVCRTWLDRRR